ncbi:Cof-type HAD-IIB family hydrolase [Ktedonobacter racemifer]|uniref:Cof-like hydrolase n=1 Tax=Ktedonobacter racemifer DSM 44963 TaxID=485913 RepID=D6TEA5_KTERA|nr:Cof-type HAD-IIB family hydrolase [Ktedonobacter racemifer]EFH90278.1 Cof-like hydrolase [Ktedonobacter racemifer DSM 44963]
MQQPLPPTSIKMIAIDIDGTLLDPHKHITPRTRAAIEQAREKGIIVTLATARRYVNTGYIASELGIDLPIIMYDGALILEHPGGRIFHTQKLQAEIAHQALEILVRHKVQPIIHHYHEEQEESWTGPEEFDTTWIAPYLEIAQGLRRLHYQRCCLGQPDPLRVVAFTSEEIIQRMLPEISALECAWNTTPLGSYRTAELSIMHQHCSKASGVQALASYLAIPLSQVMAIGDGNNDIEMLQSVGWGVAMGQARAKVREAAKAITASNAEDGVAEAIERYVLGSDLHATSNSRKRAT